MRIINIIINEWVEFPSMPKWFWQLTSYLIISRSSAVQLAIDFRQNKRLSIPSVRLQSRKRCHEQCLSYKYIYILGGCPFNGPLSGTKYPTRAASPIQNASTPKSSLPFSKHRSCALFCAGFSRTLHRVSYFVYF